MYLSFFRPYYISQALIGSISQATTALGEVLAVKEPETVSTEYRNQFAWPKDNEVPRKSISMGALKKAAVAEGWLLHQNIRQCKI